jgi:DNA-binding GntR family transcriptional regulator
MSVVKSLAPVQRTLLRDLAYRAIRDAIVREELAPGAAVRDADLAERLGLSRAPVRAALARLGEEGLVVAKPQSHTRVTPVTADDVRDAAVVVRAMHELATRLAVPRVGDGHLRVMARANHRFAKAVAARDVDAALAADDELHDVLVSLCANEAARATIERYTPLIRRLERRLFSEATGLRSVRLHERLIDACARRDVAGACAVTDEIWRALEPVDDQPATQEEGTP